jgi:hypothetical protein
VKFVERKRAAPLPAKVIISCPGSLPKKKGGDLAKIRDKIKFGTIVHSREMIYREYVFMFIY